MQAQTKPLTKKRRKFFITGTDTGVGKTCVASALLCSAKKAGMSTLGLKPVAAGAEMLPGVHENNGRQEQVEYVLQNEDAIELMTQSTVDLAYEQVNPICLSEAVAPHIAAQHENKQLSVDRVAGFCRGALMHSAQLSIVEGAGGWRVPLNRHETMANLAVALDLPVILVVGLRLGCLNHALLTAEAIRRDGAKLAGWIGVQLDPDMPVYQENVQSLAERLNTEHLAQIPYFAEMNVERLATVLDIHKILEKAEF